MSTSKADFYFVTDERCRNTVKSYFSDLQEEHVVHISGCVYFSLKYSAPIATATITE